MKSGSFEECKATILNENAIIVAGGSEIRRLREKKMTKASL